MCVLRLTKIISKFIDINGICKNKIKNHNCLLFCDYNQVNFLVSCQLNSYRIHRSLGRCYLESSIKADSNSVPYVMARDLPGTWQSVVRPRVNFCRCVSLFKTNSSNFLTTYVDHTLIELFYILWQIMIPINITSKLNRSWDISNQTQSVHSQLLRFCNGTKSRTRREEFRKFCNIRNGVT